MALTIVPWPAGLPKCPASWDASWIAPVVRTEFDGGMVKVRRRFSKANRSATATFVLSKEQLQWFRQLYENDTQNGSLPFMLATPDAGMVAQAWRFKEPPQYTAIGTPLICWQASCSLEQLPYWG